MAGAENAAAPGEQYRASQITVRQCERMTERQHMSIHREMYAEFAVFPIMTWVN